MNILITGASSALGKYFIEESLKEFPNAKILALFSSTRLTLNDERVEWLQYNLKKDIFNRNEFFNIVIHAASAVPKRVMNSSDFFNINCKGSLLLFQNINFDHSASILNISSTSVYDDPSSLILTESSLKTNKDLYGVSKLKFEYMLSDELKEKNISILTCRIPVLLSKNVKNNFIAGWLLDISQNNQLTLFNPDGLFNACITDEYIFKFFISFRENYKKKNLICNVSSNSPISIYELAKYVVAYAGEKIRINMQDSSQPAQLISNQLAQEHGFNPKSVKGSIKLFLEKK